MFRCGICKNNSQPGEPMNKKVVETRVKEYPARFKGEGIEREKIDSGGVGYETVKEIAVCSNCAEEA